MSASRSSSMRVLKHLSKQQTRSLHMCEPRAYPSRLLASSQGNPVAGASSEIRLAGDRPSAQLNDPLNTSSMSRTMTTVTNIRPTPMASTILSGPAKPISRTFNTSRALKSPNDTSTIDFAFLPMSADATSLTEPTLAVPILPHVTSSLKRVVETDAIADKVHVSEINTISGASTYVAAPSAMSELHDNESLDHDYHAVVDGLRVKSSPAKEPGTLRSLWEGMLDDLAGARTKPAFA